MTKLRIEWNNIGLMAIGATSITLCSGVIGLLGLAFDSDNGRASISAAVQESQQLTPQPDRTVKLVDFDTVQITQGVTTQTFSFALKRVITSADFGNNQSINENTPFSTFEDPSAIDKARSEGCLIAGNVKSAMEGYDFGIRASRRESAIHQENLEKATLYLRKNCTPAP
jgi:hypothetical protein